MKPRYLLDTNVVSEPLAAKPHPSVITLLERHEREIAIASVVWHELTFGARRLPDSRRRTAIERYLADVLEPNVPILPYDARAAAWHGVERARLQDLGIETAFADGQIAAVARVNDLVLVTRNVRDFRHFDGLRLEDWFTPGRPGRRGTAV